MLGHVVRPFLASTALVGLVIAGSLPGAGGRAVSADDLEPVAFTAGCTPVSALEDVCFNDPSASGDGAEEKAAKLLEELTSLVNATTPGDVIRIAMYRWDAGSAPTDPDPLTEFYEALKTVSADQPDGEDEGTEPDDGVRVRIWIDAGNGDEDNNPAFHRALLADGADEGLNFEVQECGADQCLIEGNSIFHNKLFLFNDKDGKTSVVSSMNLTPGGTMKRYVNMVVSRDPLLFDFYGGYLFRVANNSWGTWNQATERTAPGTGGLTRGYVYPQLPQHDSLAKLIEGLECDSEEKANTRIDLLANTLGSSRVAAGTDLGDAIRGLADRPQGKECVLRVLASAPEAGVIDELNGMKNVIARTYPSHDHHSKYLLLAGGPPDAEPYRAVYTGSVNVGGDAMWKAGNSNMWLRSTQAYDLYLEHFKHLWAKAAPE